MPASIPESQLLADIRLVASQLGHSPSSFEYAQYGNHAQATILRHFKTWTNACHLADLEYERKGDSTPDIPLQDIKADVVQVISLLDRFPSSIELAKLGKYGKNTYRRRLGTIDQIKMLFNWDLPWEVYEPGKITLADGAWLAGLIDGEGCFRIARPSPNPGKGKSKSYAPVFTMSLRDDDRPMLDEMIRILGLKDPSLHRDRRAAMKRKGFVNAHPAWKINLRDLPTLAFHLLPILGRFPLRSKKKYEIPVFQLAVTCLLEKRKQGRRHKAYTDDERSLLDRCYLCLHDLKQYEADHLALYKQYDLQL